MPADVESQNTSKQLSVKLAVTARLLAQELYQLKLKHLDSPKADLRLGKQGYAIGPAKEHAELTPQLNAIEKRLTELGQPDDKSAVTFGGKVKALLKSAGRAAQVVALRTKRRRLLKQLGRAIRQRPATTASLANETQSANAVVERIRSAGIQIEALRQQTYPWARRPLLISSLLLLVAIAALASLEINQPAPLLARRESTASDLSDEQFKSLEAQTSAFREQLARQQAEFHRQEQESTQRLIAAKERAFQEKNDREEAAKEKAQREKAESERRKEELAQRERAEREKQQAQAAAAELAQRDRERIAQEKAERERREREKVEQEKLRLEQATAERIAEEKRKREETERRTEEEAAALSSRSETSRAIERYLRTRYIGGGSDAQIAAVSNAMALIFDKQGDLWSEEKKYCLRNGLELWALPEAYHASRPERRGFLEQVAGEMMDCIPPRLLFHHPFDESQTYDRAKPLPMDPHAPLLVSFQPGMLVSERLETLKTAVYQMANLSPEQKQSPLAYWNMVQQYRDVYVLTCEYRGDKPGSRSRPYYFWYQQLPNGMEDVIKKVPGQHPIRQIGPPLESAPASLRLAMQRNSGAVAAEGHWTAIEKEREAQPASLPDIPGLDPKEKKIFDGIYKGVQQADAAQLANSKSIVAASGGTKMLCPKCGGYKLRMNEHTNWNMNPYASGTSAHNLYEANRQTKSLGNCDMCGGTGVVDAR